ncbi:MAG: hypothetical protein JNM88_02860 [Chitinophagaceae bacterium]|nr:hypothetical protein [Chitinophagaceae bacterium]
MKGKIRIFKTMEEQELFHLKQMRNTTPLQRFIRLFQMQQFTQRLRKPENRTRRIIIHKHGLPQ